MVEIILAAILSVSLVGLSVILFKKIPVLAKLPETSKSREPLSVRLRKQVQTLPGSETLDYELHLQKLLSRIRVLTMKTEQKTGSWLEKLRKKNSQKINHKKDRYWEELKKAKDGK